MRQFPLTPLLLLSFAAAPVLCQPSLSANDLVRKVVHNELHAEDRSNWMYSEVVRQPPPEKTLTVVETRQGELSYTERVAGRALTPQERAKEDKRIAALVSDPGQQRRARRAAEADDKKTRDLFDLLPDAFLFQQAETHGDTVKLTFTPNPAFHPRTMDANVFHKMEGYVVLNTKENRLMEIAGRLTHGVEFAGGLLGHLDPGGTFDVQRQEVGPSHWEVVRLKVNMNGKALLFKTISVHQDETHSDFRRVPDNITLSQAEDLAQKQPSETPAQ